MRARRAALALALVLLAAHAARADTAIGLGDLLAPGFGLGDSVLSGLEGLAAPGMPAAPLAPLILPAIDVGRLALQVLRAAADATVLGATDGDAGHVLGPPDAVGLETQERVLVDGVSIPAQNVTVPGRQVVIATPGVNRTVVTPPVGVPPLHYRTPAISVPIDVPAVRAPPVVVGPVEVHTPPVTTPPVRVVTPPVVVPGQNASVDVSRLDVTVQQLGGTVYVGPHAVPYEVGPYTVGQSSLPEEVPRSASAGTPAVGVLPATTLVDEPARTLVEEQRVAVLPRTEVFPGAEVFPGQHIATVEVPSQSVDTPGVQVLPSQRVPVVVPPLHVATVEVPSQTVSVPGMVVTEERVVLPATSNVAPVGGDDVGYVGYGLDDDSSLYPFVCTALVGCQHTEAQLDPWVEWADALLGEVADTVNGPVIVPG